MLVNWLLQALSKPVSKIELLETFFGSALINHRPDLEAEIRAALDRVNDSNINEFKFSRNYLITSLVYLFGPITKVLAGPSGKRQPIKVLDRQDQRNNLEDQEYVVSAFLCGRLLTGDRPMANVMEMFQGAGLWPGKTIWIDRNKDLGGQLANLLK